MLKGLKKNDCGAKANESKLRSSEKRAGEGNKF